MLRLVIAFVVCVFTAYFELLMVLNADLLMDPLSPSLPDLGYRIVPEMDYLAPYCNFGLGFLIVMTVLRACYHPRRLDILRRFLTIGSLLYFIRGVVIVCTSLPDPFAPCKNYTVDPNKSLFLIVFDKIAASISGQGELDCGDVFFSGHTATLTECVLVWMTYTSNVWLKVAAVSIMLFTCFCMLAARFHYTIDILFGFFVATVLWKVYHKYAEDAALKQKFRAWGWWEASKPGRSLTWFWALPPCMLLRNISPCKCPEWLWPCDCSDSGDPDSFYPHNDLRALGSISGHHSALPDDDDREEDETISQARSRDFAYDP